MVEEASLAGCAGHCVLTHLTVRHAVLALPRIVVVEERASVETVHWVGLGAAHYFEVGSGARNTVLVEWP